MGGRGGPMISSLNFGPWSTLKDLVAEGKKKKNDSKTLLWNGSPSTEWHLMIAISYLGENFHPKV